MVFRYSYGKIGNAIMYKHGEFYIYLKSVHQANVTVQALSADHEHVIYSPISSIVANEVVEEFDIGLIKTNLHPTSAVVELVFSPARISICFAESVDARKSQ